jgi:ribosomal protein S18 acetylase RimI-like enzyme
VRAFVLPGPSGRAAAIAQPRRGVPATAVWQGDGMTEQGREHTVRVAEPQDAAGIAAVHVRSWQRAYAAYLPAGYLDALDVAARTADWERALGPHGHTRVWVATSGEEIVGFVALGPARDEDADRRTLQVYAIYLDADMWGQGAARELMRTALAEVPPRTPVTLWVFAENERARHFYRRHGFQPDGTERTQDYDDVSLLEVRYRRG